MTYAKLENGKVINYKPFKGGLQLNNYVIFNPTREHYKQAGYYPVVEVSGTGVDHIENDELIHFTGIEWTADKAKVDKINQIYDYDTSEEVNGFYLNDEIVWIPRETRVSLQNSTSILLKNGIETATLWNNNNEYVLPCQMLLQLLDAVELYALQCFNTTAQHVANVSNMTSIEEIEQYDFTANYPEKLHINL